MKWYIIIILCLLLTVTGCTKIVPIPTTNEYRVITTSGGATYYINTTNNITNTYNISYSSFQCSGTDKLNNVSFNGTHIKGICATDQTGGGSSEGITLNQLIGNAYYFARWDMESVTAGYTNLWIPTAISGGTSAVVDGQPNYAGLITITNGVSGGSGYAYQIGNAGAYVLDNDYFTVLTLNTTFSSIFANITNTTINGTNMRFGFQDVYTIATPTDACIFNITQENITRLTAVGMCLNNSLVNRTTSNYSFLLNKTFYTLVAYVHNKSSLVRFYIFNESGNLLWNDTVTSRIPIQTIRATGHGLVVFRGGNSTARVQGVFDYMSIGINRTVIR